MTKNNTLDCGILEHHARFSRPEDIAFWNRCVAGLSSHGGTRGNGLDDAGNQIPYSCGPHSLPAMRLFMQQAGVRRLLEIGFNIGNTAAVWLALGVRHLSSCEIRVSSEVKHSVEVLAMRHKAPFRFCAGDSGALNIEGEMFDSAFVDGDHGLAGILRDIETCRRHGVRNYLFDDLFPVYGETLAAIDKSGLTLQWIFGNMAFAEDLDRSKMVVT